jgi:hypothetical protein
MRSLLNMSMFQQTVLAAETHLTEGLALKLRRAGKVVDDINYNNSMANGFLSNTK